MTSRRDYFSRFRAASSFTTRILGLAVGWTTVILPLHGCDGSSVPGGRQQASAQTAAPAEESSNAQLPTGQRVLLQIIAEPPCTIAGLAGASLSPLRIVFVGHDLSASNRTDTINDQLAIHPEIPGRWNWSGSNELSFTPTQDWTAKEYRITFASGVIANQFALDRSDITFTPRGACINIDSRRLPYRVTAPKLPSRPTDAIPDQVLISFDSALAAPAFVGKPLPEGSASFEPAIAGTWTWNSDKIITFQPKDNWIPGTSYQVTFTPAVFADSVVIPGYRYRFTTPQSSVERARKAVRVLAPILPAKQEVPEPWPFHLEFNEAVVAARLINTPLNAERAPELNPAVPGEWRWMSDRILRFLPTEHWPTGTNFVVRYSGATFGDEVPGAVTMQSFSTPAMGVRIESQELHTDPIEPRIKRVTATFSFTHPVDKREFERHLSFQYRNARTESSLAGEARAYPYKVTYDDKQFRAYVVSDPVPVPEQRAEMVLGVDAGIPSSLTRSVSGTTTPVSIGATASKAGTVVAIPDVHSYFRIEDVSVATVPNDKRGTDQVLVITSTAAAPEEQFASAVSVRLLPKQNPHEKVDATKASEAVYRWSSVEEIDDTVLEKAEKLPITLQPAADRNTKQLSLALNAEPGRALLVEIASGLTSVEQFTLGQTYRQVVQVGELPKEVRFLSPGSLLSLSGERKVSILTRDVSSIEIEVARVLPQTINQLVSQTSGNFSSSEFVSWNFGADDISQRFTEQRSLAKLAPGQANYTALDLGAFLSKSQQAPRGLFLVSVKELQKARSAGSVSDESSDHEYQEEASYDSSEVEASGSVQDRRLFLITDLGMVIKRNLDGTRSAYVVSFKSGAPQSGVTVRVLGRNGVPVYTSTTDRDGRAVIPSLVGLSRENQPTVFTAEQDGDLAFLPYDRDDRRVNISRFDVGGVISQTDAPGIQAFVFSDRGLYRPGDDIHVGLLVRPDDWKRDLSGLPLQLAITDPRGQEIRRQTVTFDRTGLGTYGFQTQESSPVGRYDIGLYILKDGEKRGSLLGATSIRVEEFLPDRMTVTAQFNTAQFSKNTAADVSAAPIGWLPPEALSILATARNLIGTPAGDRRVTASTSITAATPQFPQYAGYRFVNPIRTLERFDQPTVDLRSDAEGVTQIPINLSHFGDGLLKVQTIVQVFEPEGGRSVSTEVSGLISALPSLVGIHPRGDLDFVKRGAERAVDVLAIDRTLQPIARSGLKVQQRAQRWVSVLVKQPNGLYGYQSVLKETVVKESPLELSAGPSPVALDTSASGEFLIAIIDTNGAELNRIPFSVVGDGENAPRLDGASQLELTLNKQEYKSGETIELQIRAPYSGAGLITIERDRVYAQQWFTLNGTSSVQQIRIPKELESNGYVSVSLVRSLDSKEIFLSPLSVAVQPFALSQEPRRNVVQISVPELVKPGAPLQISYRATQPGKALLYLVDEGILQVARYKTPDPLGYFFRKRALEVDTVQILDLLLPEYSLERTLSGAGGDEDLMAGRLNPFRRKRDAPVVTWLGLVDIGPEMQHATYQVPDYFDGSVRVMAVVASEDRLGSGQASTTVRGDYVLLPSMPPAMAPGDIAQIPVTVTNGIPEAQSNEVKISALPSDGLEVVAPTNGVHLISLASGEEKTVLFEVRAGATSENGTKLGNQQLTFTAQHASGQESDRSRSIMSTVSVRPSTPLRTVLTAGASADGGMTIPIKRRDLYPEQSRLMGHVSSLPVGFAQGLIEVLSQYPYGCSEQLISQAIPALVSKRWPTITATPFKPEELTRIVERVSKTLIARQNSDGSISTWYPGGEISPETVVYAALFLLEAKDRGLLDQPRVLDNVVRFLRILASRAPNSLQEARINAGAIYALTRSGIVTTNYLTALRGWLDGTTTDAIRSTWQSDIAAAFIASTYTLLKQEQEAKKLISSVGLLAPVAKCADCFHDRFAHGGWYLYLAARHFPESLAGIAPTTFTNLLSPLISESQNTYNAGVVLLGLDGYLGSRAVHANSEGNTGIIVEELSKDNVARAIPAPASASQSGMSQYFPISAEAAQLKISGKGYLYYQLLEQGYDKAPPTTAQFKGIEVSRTIQDPTSGAPVSTVKLGDKVDVIIRARSLIDTAIPHTVIADLLPSGFEVEMSSQRFTAPDSGNSDERVWGFGMSGATLGQSFSEAREDRVLLFGTIPSESVAEFRYQLRATNRGSFTVPPVYAESMYDRSLTGIAPGATVTVTP